MFNQQHFILKKLNCHCRALWELLTSRADCILYIVRSDGVRKMGQIDIIKMEMREIPFIIIWGGRGSHEIPRNEFNEKDSMKRTIKLY